MPNVNFYLKSPDEKGNSLIYLQFKFDGARVVFTFNETIKPGAWNKKKQRPKSEKLITGEGKYLNDLLNELEAVCLAAYRKQHVNGGADPVAIKQALTDHVNGTDTKDGKSLKGLIDRFIAGDILISSGDKKKIGKPRQPSTLRNYTLTQSRLLEFERVKKVPLIYENITIDFYESLLKYLRGKTTTDPNTRESVRSISDSSIGNTVKDLKTFMGEAVERGYTTNMDFKKKRFAKLTDETDAVYLNWDEILQLFRHDLGAIPSLERVRDLFVFGCCTGLRYSDYSNIKPQNIVSIDGDKFIKMVTQKTKELVYIPCHPLVQEIFNKYQDNENRLPSSISDQKFNGYIKEACKLAGLNQTGCLLTNPELELWECISSHTARRSGLTNYYLEGFPVIDLMKISGHKTEKAFLTYIKVSKLDVAKRLSQHIKKNWGAKLLKIAG